MRAPNQFTPLALAASVMTLLIGSGAMFLVVVALKPIAAEFSWPRQVPSLAFSLQFLGAGFGGFFMGRVLDRYGMGPPALVAALTIPCGAILLSRFDAAWQLYVIYGLLIGFFGTGALAAPAMANIARWYIRRRGMAVGMVAGGQALAGIMWPPIFTLVMEAHGWRTMALAFGVVALVFLPPLAFVLRRRPEVAPGAPGTQASPERRTVARPGSPISVGGLQAGLCAAIVGCCVGADANTVGKWRRRFAERGLDGLYDEPRSGAPREIGEEQITEVIARILEKTPHGATHWSLRSMARAVGYAPSTIHRIWQAFGLQSNRHDLRQVASFFATPFSYCCWGKFVIRPPVSSAIRAVPS